MRFEIDSYLAFLYKAIERLAQLVAHSDGIAVDREVLVDPQRLEVGAQAAVIPTGYRDVLAVEDLRIALRAQGQRLDERVVRVAIVKLLHLCLRVAPQHAQILLARLHAAVAAKDCFHVHGLT